MTDKPFNNPFAALNALRDGLPSKEPVAPKEKQAPGRAVVRMERAGRGGKEVTVVEQLELMDSERAEWLKALKDVLGCGGVVEGEALVLQGDHRERVRAWLEKKGVRRVSVG